MKNIKLILVILLSIAASACGGGGGGSTTLSVALPITTVNAPAITAAALKVATGSTFDIVNPTNYAIAIIDAINSTIPTTSPLCTVPASMVTNINTAAQTGTITFTNCLTRYGKTINGTVLLSHILPTNGTPDTLFSTITFNLIVTATGYPNITLTGGYNLNAWEMNLLTQPIINVIATATGGSLTFTSNGQTEVISGIDFRNDIFSGSSITDSHGFTFSSSNLGGAFTYTQGTLPFSTTNFGSLYPHSGRAVITGANLTQLRVDVLGDEFALTQVAVDLIANGFTTTLAPYTWAQLDPT